MSDTENKTNTAPYMKKDINGKNPNESNKNNIVIPLVLLLVSAIVIVATFYENEYNSFMDQSDLTAESQDDVATTETVAEADVTIKASPVETITAETVQTATPVAEVEAKPAEVTAANIETAETTPVPVVTAEAKETVTAVKVNTQPQTPVKAVAQTASTTQQNDAYSRAQEQAKQRQQYMQQRRQAYEQEMQARRAQYEAAMKAQQERRSQMIQAQRAVYERNAQNRIATKQKVQQLHEQISQLHKEIHQIMHAPQQMVAPAPVQTAEPMQSM